MKPADQVAYKRRVATAVSAEERAFLEQILAIRAEHETIPVLAAHMNAAKP